jgi:hypothetical protein
MNSSKEHFWEWRIAVLRGIYSTHLVNNFENEFRKGLDEEQLQLAFRFFFKKMEFLGIR